VNAYSPKRPRGKRRKLSPIDPNDAKFGPKMLALNERQQKFVIAMFTTVKPGHGAAASAARAAGFGNPGSSPSSIATIASRLMQDEKIIDAMREFGEQFLKGAAPAALRALQKLILTPSHKGHERAVAAVVDRLYPVEQSIRVTHDATPAMKTTAEVLERIAELAARAGIDTARLPPLINAKPIAKSDRAA
jgi:phage terminase small subunit